LKAKQRVRRRRRRHLGARARVEEIVIENLRGAPVREGVVERDRP
jgi:hypothetical protein